MIVRYSDSSDLGINTQQCFNHNFFTQCLFHAGNFISDEQFIRHDTAGCRCLCDFAVTFPDCFSQKNPTDNISQKPPFFSPYGSATCLPFQGTGMQEVVLTVDLGLVLKNSQLLTHTWHTSLPQIATVEHSTESNGGRKLKTSLSLSYSGLQCPCPHKSPSMVAVPSWVLCQIPRTLNSQSPGMTFKDIFNNKKHLLWFLCYSISWYNDETLEVEYLYVERRLVQLILLDVKEKGISSLDDHSRRHHRDRSMVRWSITWPETTKETREWPDLVF